MARIYEGTWTPLKAVLGPLEECIYGLCGVRPREEMDWKTYAKAVLLFSAVGMALLYTLQRFQLVLPLNPRHFPSLPPALAFNTAASYVTNTNWQAYAGEATMSHFTSMAGLTAQNFVSGATGMAILVALIRGLVRRGADTLGNFWVDLVRTTLYILLPLALLFSLLLISQGGIQTLAGSQTAHVLQPIVSGSGVVADTGGSVDVEPPPTTDQRLVIEQVLALGPAATQVISRDLNTSGGGFFNANSAHPFESPTPFTDFLLLFVQTVIPAALTYTYGRLVGDTRQGWAILGAMLLVLALFTGVAYHAESAGNPKMAGLSVDVSSDDDRHPGGNMEGKEVRFGVARSALIATATTATSTGAPNGMHDSLLPIGGLVTFIMMQLGEVILGGIGSGLAGMVVFVMLAAFIGGLMIGRTPDYLGKKLEPYEIKMASLIVLVMPLAVLLLTAVAVATEVGKASMFNGGPHGFSEVMYAYTSMVNNNGSTFGGLNANTPFYNVTGGVAMLIGRFWIAIPTLALAGSLARKQAVHVSEGSLPTHTPLFAVWLVVVVLTVGAMTFLPALALGPIVEHVLMIR
jgi:K+-transporting ATPase ATPase A chain